MKVLKKMLADGEVQMALIAEIIVFIVFIFELIFYYGCVVRKVTRQSPDH